MSPRSRFLVCIAGILCRMFEPVPRTVGISFAISFSKKSRFSPRRAAKGSKAFFDLRAASPRSVRPIPGSARCRSTSNRLRTLCSQEWVQMQVVSFTARCALHSCKSPSHRIRKQALLHLLQIKLATLERHASNVSTCPRVPGVRRLSRLRSAHTPHRLE